MHRVYPVMGTLPLPRQVARSCAEQHQRRKFSLVSRSNGIRPFHVLFVHSMFQWCGRQFLGEVICRNYAGPALGRRAPCGGPRQPPKVVARLCLISPRLDLFITDAAPVKKMLIHSSTVYEDLHSTLLGIGSGSRIPMLTVV